MDLMQIMLNMSVMGDRDRKSSENERDRKSSESSDRSRKSSDEATERRESTTAEAVKNALNGLRRRSTMDGGTGGTGGAEDAERRTSFSISSDPLTFKELRCNIALFLIAGFDTTSALLGYLMYELALNPDVQERLYNEFITELDHEAELTYEEVHKLQYLDCAIKETLRMHPVVSNEIFSRRCCVPETEVNGVRFVQDMVIKPDVISVHFDQDQWGPQDVHTFCPDRHLPEYSEKRHPLAYLPFGFGPRICVGMRYALLMAKLVAVRILRDYHVTKTDETADMQTKEDVTIIPKSVNVLIERRRAP